MKVPTRQDALAYLWQAAGLNPGPWVDHSHRVPEAAAQITAHHPNLEPELAFSAGLLHDIGRREGIFGMRHVVDGYRFMLAEGYPDAARICLTHSYPIPNMMIGSSKWDGTQAEQDFVAQTLSSIAYDAYDKLIQLCDSICLPTGPVLMEKRLVDVVMRYGFNAYTLEKWQAFINIQTEFESLIGGSIYALLPGVAENTFKVSTLMES
jgi:hypothetical protein